MRFSLPLILVLTPSFPHPHHLHFNSCPLSSSSFPPQSLRRYNLIIILCSPSCTRPHPKSLHLLRLLLPTSPSLYSPPSPPFIISHLHHLQFYSPLTLSLFFLSHATFFLLTQPPSLLICLTLPFSSLLFL